MATHLVGQSKPAPQYRVRFLWLAVRSLALADALAFPAALVLGIWSWHAPIPDVRMLLGLLAVYWAAKRAYAATVGFATFKWRLTRVAVATLLVWLLMRFCS